MVVNGSSDSSSTFLMSYYRRLSCDEVAILNFFNFESSRDIYSNRGRISINRCQCACQHCSAAEAEAALAVAFAPSTLNSTI